MHENCQSGDEKKQIFRAMLIGGIVGLFGVAIFLGILQASTQLSLKKMIVTK